MIGAHAVYFRIVNRGVVNGCGKKEVIAITIQRNMVLLNKKYVSAYVCFSSYIFVILPSNITGKRTGICRIIGDLRKFCPINSLFRVIPTYFFVIVNRVL